VPPFVCCHRSILIRVDAGCDCPRDPLADTIHRPAADCKEG